MKLMADLLTLRELCQNQSVNDTFFLRVYFSQTIDFASVFVTARALLNTVYAMAVSVCVSVTSEYSTKTAKHRNAQMMPHDSAGTLVF